MAQTLRAIGFSSRRNHGAMAHGLATFAAMRLALQRLCVPCLKRA